MAAAAGISNHQITAGQALAGRSALPMAAGNNSSGSSASSGAAGTITANDFLTLLVTEMKNQDPTATTDPNEYINQLVNVNSLQQLIQINQTLSADASASTSTGKATSSSETKSQNGAVAETQATKPGEAAGVSGAIHAAASALAPGNLGIPAANPAASRVAQSLSGRLRVE